MPDRCTRTNTAIIALIAGLPLLIGCSDRDADSKKVSEAARQLASVGSAGSSDGYKAVSSSIRNIDANDETASAVVSGLLSQSLQGEGSIDSSKAALAERSLLDDLDAALVMGRRFQTLTTTAVSMEAFDPTEDLEDIAQQLKQLESDEASQRSVRAELAGRIENLESSIADLDSQSSSIRNQAAEMKLESSKMSAVQAAARAGSIRLLSREADALEMQISRLSGEAAALRPRLTEIDAELNKLEQQHELGLESAQELREMARDRAVRAETSRAEANSIAEKIRDAINAINSVRSEKIIPQGVAATDSLEKAVQESGKSAREVRAAGTLGKSSAQRRLAEMLQLRAHGHERFATTLEKLSDIEGLPGNSSYADAANEEHAAAANLRSEAAQAYEDAASSLESVRVRGADSDRTQKTADRLRDLARLMRNEEVAPEQPEDPAP